MAPRARVDCWRPALASVVGAPRPLRLELAGARTSMALTKVVTNRSLGSNEQRMGLRSLHMIMRQELSSFCTDEMVLAGMSMRSK